MNIAEPVEVLPDASSLSDLGSDAPPEQVGGGEPIIDLPDAVADEPTTPATSPAPTEPSAEELRAKRVTEAQETLAAMAAAHGYTLEQIAAAKPSRKPRANRSKAVLS